MVQGTDKPRQVVHCDAHQSFNSSMANEAEREKWTKETYDRKNSNKDKNNHYDFSRRKLNFEINSKGEIIEQGTQQKHITERLNERLKEMNFKFSYDKLGNLAANSPNCCIDFVVSGNRNVMRRLAFGEQQVNYSDEKLGKANWNVRREKAIEDWARKEYEFFAKKFGAQNVISFQVHLDETTPHAHVLVVPVAKRKSFGRTRQYQRKDDATVKIKMKEYEKLSEREKENWTPCNEKKLIDAVSYGRVVGRTHQQFKCWIKDLHTEHYEEVGRFFGLERGDDLDLLSEDEKMSRRHMSKTELKAFKDRENKRKKLDEENEKKKVKSKMLDISIHNKILTNNSLTKENSQLARKSDNLNKEIKKMKTEVKGLTTMRDNIQNDIEKIRKELANLEPDQERYNILKEQLSVKEEQLQHRNEQIDSAKNKLDDLRNKYYCLKEDYSSLKEETRTLQSENERARKEKEDTQRGRVAHVAKRNKFIADQRSAIMNAIASLAFSRLCEDIASSLNKFKSSTTFMDLPDYERDNISTMIDSIFDDSSLRTLTEKGQQVMYLTAAIFMNTITPSDVSSGDGGGGCYTSSLRWDGKRDDESDMEFMSRCFEAAMKIMSSSGRRNKKQSQGLKSYGTSI